MSLVNGRNLKRARRSMVCSAAVGAAWAGILCPGGATAQAASGTWITNATGLWSASTNWSGGVVADGSGNTADFSTLDISGTSLTVNLDSARTIGQLLFEDQTNLSTDWILANNATPANVLTLGTGAGTPTISVFDRTATITTILAGTQGLAKNGGGTLVLAAANTLTGGVSSSGGLLKLDFSQATSPTTNIIPASNAFTLNGGTLQISGKASTTNSQAFAGTTLSGGGGLITMSPATTNPLLLNLGAITRSPGAALNVTLSGTSSATNGVASSTANNSTGIIGGYATVGGATNAGDWAANNGANVVAYTAYNTAFPTTGGDSSINYSTTAGSTLTSDVIANSLKVISGANTYALGGNNLTFSGAAGGLLYADSSASSFTGTGVLGAGSGNEFIVQDWGAGALTIGTPIIGTSVGETGRLTKAGTGTIVLTAANTYTGGTMLVGGQITVSNNAALGTGSIEINPNGVVGTGNGCKLLLSSGVTIANNIIMDRATAGSGTNGTIDGSAGATGISGNITINGIANPGGTFIGPTTAGTFLTITGSITNNLAADNGGTDAIIVRNGNVLLSGGGSYYRFDERAGTLAIGVSNGVATNASVDLGGNGTATFDLAGLNQTLNGVSTLLTTTGANIVRTVTNSSTSSASTLTLAPLASGSPDSNLVFGAVSGSGSSASITDASASTPLNIVINGAATGTQVFSTATSSYHGSTKLSSGTLSVTSLANGGSNSSIGASSNDAANLVFDGGTLLYTGGTTSTDRNFTINSAKVAAINVSSAAATLTMSGGTSATTGGLTKLGAGALLLSGTHAYTGNTTVSAGTLFVNGTLGATNTSVASSATLGGTGTLGGTVTVNAAGNLAPGVNGVGTLSFNNLSLATANVVVDFSGADTTPGGASNDLINVAGTLDLTGGASPLTVNFAGTPTVGNVYKLIGYNTLSGPATNLVAASRSLSIINNSGAKEIDVQATNGSAGNLRWNSTSNSNWDIVQSVNWFNTGTSSNDRFYQADNVTFDDSAGVQTNINVAAVVQPTAVTVNSNTNNFTFSGTGKISGTAALSKSGSSTLTITSNNDYTGTTTIGGGAINVGGGGASGTLGSGDITDNASLIFNRSGTLALANNIGGSGSITQAGPGTTTLSGNNSYAGNTNVNAGTLSISAAGNLGAGNIVFGGGSVAVSGSPTLGNAIVVNTGGGTISGAVTLTGAITGGAALAAGGGGATIMNGDLTGFTGTLTSNGQINLNSTTSSSAAAAFVVNAGGTNGLIMTAGGTYTVDMGSLAGIGEVRGSNSPIGNIALSIGALNTNTTFSGAIANDTTGGGTVVSLIKVGSGTLTLSGQESYTGATTVNGGTLELAANQPPLGELYGTAAGGSVTVNAGATLLVSGSNAAIGFNNGGTTFTVNAGGTMTTANANTSHLGNITLNGGTLASGTPNSSFGSWAFTGTPTVTVTDDSTISATGMSGATNFNISAGKTLTLSGNYNGPTVAGGSHNLTLNTGAGTLLITSDNSLNTGALAVNAGTVTIAGAASIGSATLTATAPGALNINGTIATTATVNASGPTSFGGAPTIAVVDRSFAALNIGSGSTATVTPSAFPFAPTVLQPATTVFADATATLDLTNNELITAGDAPTAQTLITTGQVFSTGLPSNFALGYLSLPNAQMEIRYTLKGDADLSGKVDVGDLGALATSYGISGGMSWANGDFNHDNNVDVGDLGALATNYGSALAGSTGAAAQAMIAGPMAVGGSPTSVPEPASLGLLGIGAIGLLQRRRTCRKGH